jgi:hypothetical protein
VRIVARALSAPALHFLVLGASLFLLLRATLDPAADPPRRIVITGGQIESLAENWMSAWKRPPSAIELKGLIDEWVKEEIYYREGTAMGFERDDWFLRQHLRKKLEFLRDDLALEAEPPPGLSDDARNDWIAERRRAALEEYYQSLLAKYRVVVEPKPSRGDAS